MTMYLLMEMEMHAGGLPRGLYSTREKALEEAGKPYGASYWAIVPVEIDAPEGDLDYEMLS